MALRSGAIVIAQDATETLPTMHFTGQAADLSARAEVFDDFLLWLLIQPARMARKSFQGWRTKFMVDPMGVRRIAKHRASKKTCQWAERADGQGAASPVPLGICRWAE